MLALKAEYKIIETINFQFFFLIFRSISQLGTVLPPKGHCQCLQTFLIMMNGCWGGPAGISTLLSRGQGCCKHSRILGHPPTTKNHSVQNVNSAEIGKETLIGVILEENYSNYNSVSIILTIDSVHFCNTQKSFTNVLQ